MHISQAIECKSYLELLFLLKEELVLGTGFVTVTRGKITYPPTFSNLLDIEHCFWITEDGVAYSLTFNSYYDNSLFPETKHLSTEKLFQFILDNQVKIDKMFKLKIFI